MKKLIYFPFLIIFICLCFCDSYCFMDTLKSLDLAEYKVFCDDGNLQSNFDNCLMSGNCKIYTFYSENIDKNTPAKNALCEQVMLTCEDALIYIKNNNLKAIKTEYIDGIKIDYFYCKKLPKKSYCFGTFYNIVIATKNNTSIVGYPAIMGSL